MNAFPVNPVGINPAPGSPGATDPAGERETYLALSDPAYYPILPGALALTDVPIFQCSAELPPEDFPSFEIKYSEKLRKTVNGRMFLPTNNNLKWPLRHLEASRATLYAIMLQNPNRVKPVVKYTDALSTLAERYLQLWILARNAGREDLSFLEKESLDNFDTVRKEPNLRKIKRTSARDNWIDLIWWIDKRDEFMHPHLAIILSNELENPAAVNILSGRLGIAVPGAADLRIKEREVLQEIYDQYLKGKDEYALMRVEIKMRQAMIAKSLSLSDPSQEATYGDLLAEANGLVDGMATLDCFTRVAGGKVEVDIAAVKKLLKTSGKFLPQMLQKPHPFGDPPKAVHERYEELARTISTANLWKAQILMLEGSDLTDPSQIYHKLQAAEAYLLNTQILDGLHLLEAKRLLAENRILQGFMLKALGRKEEALQKFYQAHQTIAEIQKWIRGYEENYLNPGSQASQDLDKMLGGRKFEVRAPRWLVQIKTQTELWQNKLVQAVVGDATAQADSRIFEMVAPVAGKEPSAIRTEVQTKEGYLKLQSTVLQSIYAKVSNLKALIYSYPSGDQAQIIRYENIISLDMTLAENLTRQAFIRKDLGEAGWQTMLETAKGQLKTILDPKTIATPLTKAEANLWMAKIIVVEAGEADTLQRRNALLKSALPFLKAAKDTKKLVGTSLSSLYQAYGEIYAGQKQFYKAEAWFRKALSEYAQNYEARAALGDVLNWQGKHTEAIKVYRGEDSPSHKIPEDHPIYNKAKLGIAEATMRRGENYSKDSLSHTTQIILEVLTAETKGSFLVMRALDDLAEAFSTNEDLLEDTLILGNAVLGLKLKTSSLNPEKQPFEAEIESRLKLILDLPSVKNAVLTARFKANLYLKVADALSSIKIYDPEEKKWVKPFDQAKDFLGQIPREFLSLIQKDAELSPLHDLIAAEIEMRKEKTAQPFTPELVKKVLDSRDPDLISRVILDLTEAYNKEKDYEKVVETAKKYLEPETLKSIKSIFDSRGRIISFTKFKFKLWFNLAEALASKKIKKYGEAMDELNRILSEAQNLKEDSLLSLRSLIIAKSYLRLGDIYSYRWKGRDYKKSIENYKLALQELGNVADENLSKDAVIVRAYALIGIANNYNYGRGIQDYGKSKEYYEKARAIIDQIPVKSDERDILEIKYHHGLGILHQQESEVALAEDNFVAAERRVDQAFDVPDQLEGDVDRSSQSAVPPHLKTEFKAYRDEVNGGEKSSTETQTNLTLQAPLSNGRFIPYFRNQTDSRYSSDSKSEVNTSYAGFGLRLLDKQLTINTEFKIPGSSVFLSENHLGLPLYFRQPDGNFSFSYWGKYLTTSLSTSQDFSDSRLSTYYADVMYNLGHLKNPLLNLRIGPTFSYYHFIYTGDFKERFSAGLGAKYELDLAEIFDMDHNFLKLKLGGTLPLYEREYDPKLAALGEPATFHRFPFTDPFPWGRASWQWNAGFELNFGDWGLLMIEGGGNHQLNPLYRYNALYGSLNYRLGIPKLTEILSEIFR